MIPESDSTPSPSALADEVFTMIEARLTSYWQGVEDGGLGYRMTWNRVSQMMAERMDQIGCPTAPSTLWVRTRTLSDIRTLIESVFENEE